MSENNASETATKPAKPRAHKPAHSANHRRNGSHGVHHTNRAAALLGLQDTAARTLQGLTEQLDDLKEKGIKSSKALDEVILANPKTSVLMAFGVGYVLARFRRWL